MFRNKHVITAMIVAPILAVLAYFATDYVVSEKPHAAIEGQSYALVAKSNCRYESGICTLENGDISIKVKADTSSATDIRLSLQSNIALTGAKVAVSDSGSPVEPTAMTASEADGMHWQVNVENPRVADPTLQLVVGIGGSMYFAETGMKFSTLETGFSRENWSTTNGE